TCQPQMRSAGTRSASGQPQKNSTIGSADVTSSSAPLSSNSTTNPAPTGRVVRAWTASTCRAAAAASERPIASRPSPPRSAHSAAIRGVTIRDIAASWIGTVQPTSAVNRLLTGAADPPTSLLDEALRGRAVDPQLQDVGARVVAGRVAQRLRFPDAGMR